MFKFGPARIKEHKAGTKKAIMILIPYYSTEKSLSIGCKISTLWLFMAAGGREIWKVDDTTETILREYFNENGLFGQHIPTSRSDVVLYKVDTEKTKLSDFHTWSDALSTGTEPDHLWRPFFWLGEGSPGEIDRWGWKEEVSATRFAPFDSMADIWDLVASGEKNAGLSVS
jgi:hypothetical protein